MEARPVVSAQGGHVVRNPIDPPARIEPGVCFGEIAWDGIQWEPRGTNLIQRLEKEYDVGFKSKQLASALNGFKILPFNGLCASKTLIVGTPTASLESN